MWSVTQKEKWFTGVKGKGDICRRDAEERRGGSRLRTSLTNLVPEAWSCKSACVFRWWFTDEQTWVFSNWPVPLGSVCVCPCWLWIGSGNGPLSCMCLHISCSSSLQIEGRLRLFGKAVRKTKNYFFFPVHFKKGFETLLFIKRYCKLSVGQLEKQQDYKVAWDDWAPYFTRSHQVSFLLIKIWS